MIILLAIASLKCLSLSHPLFSRNYTQQTISITECIRFMRVSSLLLLLTLGSWGTALEARIGRRVHALAKITTSAFDGFRQTVVNQTGSRAPPPTPSVNGPSATGARVAYGHTANSSQFPFAVWLTDFHTTCGGSLIAPRVVLTAARCVTLADGAWSDIENIILEMGVVDVQSSTTDYTLQVREKIN
jgi:hypothetical protein